MSDERRGSLTIGWRVILRQIKSNPSVAVTIFAATLIAVGFLAATPGLIERVSNEALDDIVTSPPVEQRNIAVSSARRIGPSNQTDPFRHVRETGTRFAEANFTPAIQSVIADQTWHLETPDFGVFDLEGEEEGPFPSFVRFRQQSQIDNHTVLAAGRMPQEHEPYLRLSGQDCPDDLENLEEFEPVDDLECELQEIPVFEVVMTAETLSVLSFGLDQLVILRPDPLDPLFRQLPQDEIEFELGLIVTGVVELTDQGLDYWYGDARLHRSSITENADFRIISAAGLISPTEYGRLLRETGRVPWNYTWRYFVNPEAVDATTVQALAADLRALELGFSSVLAHGTDYGVVTLLSTLIEGFLGQLEVTAALMSMVLAGVFAVALALNLELAGLASLRQRDPVILVRNRGSSGGQLNLSRLYQGVLIVAPGAVIGYLAAKWAIPDTDYLLPYRLTVAFAGAAIAAFVLAASPLIFKPLGKLQRTEPLVQKSGKIRVVAEVLVLALAIGAVLLLRRRGQIDTRESLVFDPLLAVTPALMGVAFGMLTIRVYPLLIRGLATLISRGKSLVPFVGLRRILQQPLVARLPIVVILMAASIAVFAVTVRASIIDAQYASAVQEIGADYAVLGSAPGRALPNSLDLSSVPAIESQAEAFAYPTAREASRTTGLFEFLAIDAPQYEVVMEGSPDAADFPDFLFLERGEDSGTEQSPLPVIASTGGWAEGQTPSLGDTLTIDLGRLKPVVRIAAFADRWPGLNGRSAFVVSSLKPIQNLSAPLPLERTTIYLKAPETASDEISVALGPHSTSIRFDSRYDALRRVVEAPLVVAVDQGLMITVGLAVAFAAVAAVSSLALSSAVRRRDLGYLKTMGLEPGQATALTVIEQLPLLLVSASVGGLVGVGMVVALQPTILLESFTGGFITATIEYDWTTIILASVVLTVVLAVATVIFIAINRRDDLGSLVRVGDE